VKLNPNYATAYYSRGSALEFKRDYDGAIADFDRAIKLNPAFALAWYDAA
jgi:tetratricopeptide (TPR) repeat protein